MDMGTDALLDFIFGMAGVYLIYMGAKMLIKKELVSSTLLSKNVDLNKAQDPAGYIKIMGPATIIVGAFFVLLCIVNRVFSGTEAAYIVNLTTMTIEVIVILVFGFISHKAEKDHLRS